MMTAVSSSVSSSESSATATATATVISVRVRISIIYVDYINVVWPYRIDDWTDYWLVITQRQISRLGRHIREDQRHYDNYHYNDYNNSTHFRL
jgi:hypothetical protein